MPWTGVTSPLEVALQHLAKFHEAEQQQQQEQLLPWQRQEVKRSKDYQPPLSSTTAHALHSISRRYRSAACGTCTYLGLDSYSFRRVQTTDIPWGFLAAAPAVTALSIQQNQVPDLLAGPQGIVGSLVGRLRQLQVTKLDRRFNNSSSSMSWEEKVGAVGRLLGLCTCVQVLDLGDVSDLSKEDQQLLEKALVAGVTASAPAVVTSSTADMELRSSSSGGSSLAATAAAGGGTSVGAQAAVARLPLLQLNLRTLPLSVCGPWLQHRGQLEQLRSLCLESWDVSDFARSWGWLTSLVGLQELKLVYRGVPDDPCASYRIPIAPTDLSSSLTHLAMRDFAWDGLQAKSLAALTALQRLQLVGCTDEEPWGCDWLTALKQLTFLNLSKSSMEELPGNLGQALPHLQVLLVANTWCGDLPKGMTRLTRLDAHSSHGLSDASLTAISEATALRQLNLSGCFIKYAACLSACSGLEVLEMQQSGAVWEEVEEEEGQDSGSPTPSEERRRRRLNRSDYADSIPEAPNGSGDDSNSSSSSSSSGWSPPPPPTLPCVPHLRHLDLARSGWWVSDLVTMGGLQHLTFLGLSHGLAKEGGVSGAGSLPALGVLPALQQLNLSCVGVEGYQWPAVGAWLGQQPQLTRLSLNAGMYSTTRHLANAQQQAQGLAQLPTQLVGLDLSNCGLQQLPARLSQMTDLRTLLVGHNDGLPPKLPAWLPELQQLKVLHVHGADSSDIHLLRQLPRLRQFQGHDDSNGGRWQTLIDLKRQLPVGQGYGFAELFPAEEDTLGVSV